MLYFFGYLLSWTFNKETSVVFSETGINDGSHMIVTTKNPEIVEKILSYQKDVEDGKIFLVYGQPYSAKVGDKWMRHLKLMDIKKVEEET